MKRKIFATKNTKEVTKKKNSKVPLFYSSFSGIWLFI